MNTDTTPDTTPYLRPERVCETCAGTGEVAVSGTYGATVSPELLETVPCHTCHGDGVVGP